MIPKIPWGSIGVRLGGGEEERQSITRACLPVSSIQGPDLWVWTGSVLFCFCVF